MTQGASLEPVDFDVNNLDVDAARAYVRRRRHGLSNPTQFALGLATFALGVWMLPNLHSLLDRWRELRCSASGLSISFAFTGNVFRSYPWRRIRAIEDAGESFVLVTWLFKHFVLPKHSFNDGGREAWAFIADHGVRGRVCAAQTVAI